MNTAFSTSTTAITGPGDFIHRALCAAVACGERPKVDHVAFDVFSTTTMASSTTMPMA
jgi:hypothetical protein